MTTLAQGIKSELVVYLRHLAGRVEKAVRALPKDKVYVKPYPYGNSIGHLVLHLTGNLNHYIGAGIAKTGYERDRPREFVDPTPPPPEEALKRFHEAVAMVVKTIEGMDEASLLTAVPDQPPVQTRFGLLLVCIAHINNHIGQMAYLVQQLGYSTAEPPMW
jgi:uncharacterized damage-inducible protein DinB